MRYTYHAINQYAIRTGRHAIDALLPLEKGVKESTKKTLHEVLDMGFSIIKVQKGDEYITWHDSIIGEDLCGIISKDNSLKTVLTKEIYSWSNRPIKTRNDIYEKRM